VRRRSSKLQWRTRTVGIQLRNDKTLCVGSNLEELDLSVSPLVGAGNAEDHLIRGVR